MIKPKSPRSSLVLLFLFLLGSSNCLHAQENEDPVVYKNQLSTNLMLPAFESFDLNYERTIANKWALGLAVAIYGDRISELSTGSSGDFRRYDTNYEFMPFVRLYFQGAQHKSHFLELFGSLSRVTASGRFVRNTNTAGFGVYEPGETDYTAGGLGIGYGYRFLLLNKKLVLEAQFGVRTNFNVDYYFLNGSIIRTGFKIGYRF
ncbi:MAG: DUF3575 domain-containing protein [Maribacter sp.]|uniref:DUF3575 domain-containing protein n=1 Tax=Maribacter sp. TaxID=1897614 RepID=UPI003296A81D